LAPLHNQDQHRAVVGDEMPFCHMCSRGFSWDLTTAEQRPHNHAVLSMYI
jgi:hypothetical protein